MLRKKLILILGSLVLLLLAVALTVVWQLQAVVHDLDLCEGEHAGVVGQVNELGNSITTVELELRQLQLRNRRHLNTIIDTVDRLRQQTAQLVHSATGPAGQEAAARLRQIVPNLEQHVGRVATTEDATLAEKELQESLAAAVDARKEILNLGTVLYNQVLERRQTITARFRFIVQGMALLFLFLINVSAFVLLHVATMILRPVDRLVEASRQLAQERFDYRVQIDQKDEFEELARSFNHLAAQLQANEERKLQMLAQVALTLDHELNNAGAIIEMQLGLLSRQGKGDPAFEKCLRQIRESLSRMTQTLAALKRVRRIVLTDYIAGLQMLDLQRSTQEDIPAINTGAPQHPRDSGGT